MSSTQTRQFPGSAFQCIPVPKPAGMHRKTVLRNVSSADGCVFMVLQAAIDDSFVAFFPDLAAALRELRRCVPSQQRIFVLFVYLFVLRTVYLPARMVGGYPASCSIRTVYLPLRIAYCLDASM
jgi:hypothetical protein